MGNVERIGLLFAVGINFIWLGAAVFIESKEEKSYDERMRMIRGRVYRDVFCFVLILCVFGAVISGLQNIAGGVAFADTQTTLFLVLVAGLSLFLADSIVRGSFAGRGETPRLYLGQVFLYAFLVLTYIVAIVLLGEDRDLSLPLSMRSDVTTFALLGYCIIMLLSNLLRYILHKEELSEE